MSGKAGHRGFGHIRKLPSGRYQAMYADPTGRTYLSSKGNARPVSYKAPHTFGSREDAEEWLVDRRREIRTDDWAPPTARRAPITFREHADRWIAHRDLKPRTRMHYQRILNSNLLPSFGDLPLKHITIELVDEWYERLDPTRPTLRAHTYGLLRTILGSAVQRRLIEFNPVHVRGAGNSKRVKKIKPATLDELATLVAAMPERLQLLTLLAAWCALRFGELTELRRKDIDIKRGVVAVRRGVVRVDDVPDPLPRDSRVCPCRPGCIIGPPKSDAGVRDVAIPPPLMPLVRAALRDDISGGRDGLIFPAEDGGHLAPSTLYGKADILDDDGKVRREGWGFYRARDVAGRSDLRFHDLRHTGAVLAAQTGATLAELMNRLGHSTPGAALRYQHASSTRDAEIAKALSKLVEAR